MRKPTINRAPRTLLVQLLSIADGTRPQFGYDREDESAPTEDCYVWNFRTEAGTDKSYQTGTAFGSPKAKLTALINGAYGRIVRPEELDSVDIEKDLCGAWYLLTEQDKTAKTTGDLYTDILSLSPATAPKAKRPTL